MLRLLLAVYFVRVCSLVALCGGPDAGAADGDSDDVPCFFTRERTMASCVLSHIVRHRVCDGGRLRPVEMASDEELERDAICAPRGFAIVDIVTAAKIAQSSDYKWRVLGVAFMQRGAVLARTKDPRRGLGVMWYCGAKLGVRPGASEYSALRVWRDQEFEVIASATGACRLTTVPLPEDKLLEWFRAPSGAEPALDLDGILVPFGDPLFFQAFDARQEFHIVDQLPPVPILILGRGGQGCADKFLELWVKAAENLIVDKGRSAVGELKRAGEDWCRDSWTAVAPREQYFPVSNMRLRTRLAEKELEAITKVLNTAGADGVVDKSVLADGCKKFIPDAARLVDESCGD